MSKIKITVFGILINFALSLLTPLYSEDTFKFSDIPVSGGETAVLVLAPGMNTDGAFFLKEAPWMEFAKRNNLGVIALNYSSSEEDLYQNRKGYSLF